MVKVGTILKFARDLGIDQAIYTLIDTEGHEPAVIKGMVLEDKANQKLFRCFNLKLEVDGTNYFPNYTGTNIRLQCI